MSAFGKTLVFVGVLLILAGLLLAYAPKVPWLGRLPGDILIKRGRFTFYFPLTTSIILSVILTLLFRFFGRK